MGSLNNVINVLSVCAVGIEGWGQEWRELVFEKCMSWINKLLPLR